MAFFIYECLLVEFICRTKILKMLVEKVNLVVILSSLTEVLTLWSINLEYFVHIIVGGVILSTPIEPLVNDDFDEEEYSTASSIVLKTFMSEKKKVLEEEEEIVSEIEEEEEIISETEEEKKEIKPQTEEEKKIAERKKWWEEF